MGITCSAQNTPVNQSPVFHQLKVVIVGDTESGKSSVLQRYCKNQFNPLYFPTKKVSIENVTKKINIPAPTLVSITFWDIPGREDLDLHEAYFRNVDAVIVVVDLTDPDGVEMAGTWRQEVLNKAMVSEEQEVTQDGLTVTSHIKYVPVDKKNLPILLLGNKIDMMNQQIQANSENSSDVIPIKENDTNQESFPKCVQLLRHVAEEHEFLESMVVSARDKDGSVDVAVQYLVRHVIQKALLNSKSPREKKPLMQDTKSFKKADNVLEGVGYAKLDSLFTTADVLIKRVRGLDNHKITALKRFREKCSHCRDTPTNASLEECVTMLRKSMKTEERKLFKVVDDDGFCRLMMDGHAELPGRLSKRHAAAIDCFNNEFAAVCKAILRECPQIDIALQRSDRQVADEFTRSCDDIMSSTGQSRVRLTGIIENNRALIDTTRRLSRQCVNDVEIAYKKMYAALAWLE